ncbi:hypothetical protein EYM_00435 [Ignicoccus islandicus DSM 13165]|uniref:4Fe-4S ferredoxin-type domain-containing protein n=1 Tax=Ignicoccus islandicus DSM 13165 TaxID=940295 RepID=A0A0U3E9X7_9CREN|nr:4Fe-4S dicluster domain-containing protein [Ignicoccus islandicus]ALU12110.1 hypothetical protein EYM_00435 [Ignicoccus islandicus DSM 13165]
MKVLELSKSDKFNEIPRVSADDLENTLKRESVIVIGKLEEVMNFAKKLDLNKYVERLFICPEDLCPEEELLKVAKEADKWIYTYSIKFGELPKGKVSRKDVIKSIVSISTKKELVKLPIVNEGALCLSPYCTKCKDVCKWEAIRLRDNYVSIDPDKCVSCGDCVAVCPQRVLSMPGFDDRALGRLENVKKIWLLEPSEIFPEAFSKESLVLFWNPRDELVKILRSLGFEVCYGGECYEELPEKLSNCKFVQLIDDQHVKRLRIRGWPGSYKVKIDEKLCTFCLQCVNVCPTHALEHVFLDPVRKSIQFYPSNCIGCEACVNACPPNKGIIEMGIDTIRVIELEEANESECNSETLVTEGGKEFQCFLCGKPIDVSPSSFIELYNTLKTLSTIAMDSIDLETLYSALLPLLQTIACNECSDKLAMVINEKAKKAILRLALLYLSCIYRRKRLIPGDPLEIEDLVEKLGLSTINDPCYEWERRIELFKVDDLIT